MAMVEIYNQSTDGRAVVDEVSLPHYFRAGWMLASDWDARQQAEAEARAQPPPAPSKPSVSATKEK